jgi:hypothetical protein
VPGKPLRVTRTPEVPRIGHAWAHLPDLAETIVGLAEREAELSAAETFHFGGHFLPGRAMAEAIRCADGNDRLPIRAFQWLLVHLSTPFVTFMRESSRCGICGARRFSSTIAGWSRC